MTKTLEAVGLDTFEVAADGLSVGLGFHLAGGGVARVVVPGDCIGQLVMTLPRMARLALTRRYRDDRLRVVFPVRDLTLEAAGGSDGYILTLRTEDGFEASYAVGRETLSGLSALLEGEKTSRDGAPVVPN